LRRDKKVQSLKKFFSIGSITQKSVLLLTRFPVSVTLLLLLACVLFLVSIDGAVDERFIIFLSIGATISIAATLWLEDVVNYKKQLLITGAATLLWGVYCIFLPADESGIAKGKILELWAIAVFSASAILFICFLKRDRETVFWNFVWETLIQFGAAIAFGVIILIGLFCASLAMEVLFDYDFDDKTNIRLVTFCFVLFTPFYFLANIPDKTAKYNEDIRQDKTSAILGLYILTPLAAIYAVILYLYLFKIIFTWELPQGLVSWLVSALACCGLMIITLLYPTRQLGKNSTVNFLSRWFGIIILPLIVLMSIGISRRLSDYGVTVARLYLLLANLWFYGIYAYIFITKAQRIKWILISAAAIFLLTSIGPWNIRNVTKHILTAEVKKALGEEKIPGPVVKVARKYAYARTIDDEDSLAKIQSKIYYLHTAYGEKSVEQFFNPDAKPADKDSVQEKTKDIKKSFIYDSWEINHIYYTNEFNSFVRVAYTRNDKNIAFDFDKYQMTITVIPDSRKFYIPIRKIALKLIELELIEMHESDPNYRVERHIRDNVKRRIQDNKEHIFEGAGYIVIINTLIGYYDETNDEITVHTFHGYLFYDR
jgi:hypothetical protein